MTNNGSGVMSYISRNGRGCRLSTPPAVLDHIMGTGGTVTRKQYLEAQECPGAELPEPDFDFVQDDQTF